MINRAIAKITDEMMKTNNPAIRAIEEHLTKKCINNRIAEKILSPQKTLNGAYEKMKEEAKKLAGGSGEICISDEHGFRIVDEYFEISELEEKKVGKIDVTELL